MVPAMTKFHNLPLIGLTSLLAVACGDDGGTSATQSGEDTSTGESADPSTGTPSPTNSDPTTGIDSGESQTGTGTSAGETTADVLTGTTQASTEVDTLSTGPGETTVAETSTGPDDTSSSTSTGPDDTSSSTTDGTTTADTEGTTEGTTDGTTTETTDTGPDPDCQAPATQPPCDQNTDDIFKAMGLNCSADKTMAIPITNPVITSPDPSAYRVATHFGSAMDPMDPAKYMWGPREGERMLVLTTGSFPALQADGGLIEMNGSDSQSNTNPDGLLDLPGIMNKQEGSNNGNGGTPFMNCDGVGDCSDTINPQWNISQSNDANDVFYMSFDLQVPLGTHGYIFDFAYFSEEYPNFINDPYNDMLVVWSTSETFTGNVTFINGQPLTVTALQNLMSVPVGDPLLAGTGFPGDGEGAGTGWFEAKGSAAPGETFTVAITIFDMADSSWDTVGILDKFRWDCVGCIPTEVMSCGVQPQ
jgi:hypothetical protein